MVMNMSQNYLVVQDGVVTNVCVWDGNSATWTPPQGATMLVQATTPAVVWVWNEQANDTELKEIMGVACVGFTWDGKKCTTNQPKPQVTEQA
jgi:hypothetical protein